MSKQTPEARRRWREGRSESQRQRDHESKQRWRERNPNYNREYHQRSRGITPEMYEELVRAQAGCCAICRRRPDYDLSIDHDHATGQVRGLLCQACNIALGYIKDDPLIARAIVAYLESFREQA